VFYSKYYTDFIAKNDTILKSDFTISTIYLTVYLLIKPHLSF